MPKSTIPCTNCSQQFEAHYPFCPYCGQRAEDKLTLGVLFSNTISNYFSVDARFFKSFIPLMAQPGYLAKRFVQGQRLLYLHPAQMYLFISVVFFFLFSFISREQAQTIDSELRKDIERSKEHKDSIQEQREDSIVAQKILQPLKDHQKQFGIKDEEMRAIDSVVNIKQDKASRNSLLNFDFNETEIDSMITAGASDEAIYDKMGMKADDGKFTKRFYKQSLKFLKSKSGGSILQAFYDSIPIAMFVLLPIFALILKLFYNKKGRFAHHLVFSFYFFAFLFMVFGFLVFANLVWEDFPGWIITLIILSTFFYLFLGLKRFYEQGAFLSFIKSSMITFLFLMFVLPLAAGIMGLMAFLFY